MSVGVNAAPGWGNTVYGLDPAKMDRCLDDLKPSGLRMPWVNNAACIDAWRRCVAAGVDVILQDTRVDSAQATADQIAAVGVPCFVEGWNEPDGGANAPIDPAILAQVHDRQLALYAAVAGRFQVLSPPAAWQQNDAALNALPCDILSFHRYSSTSLPASDKPMWVTETGISTVKKWVYSWLPFAPFPWTWVHTEAQQRDGLVANVAALKANGAARVFVYCLENTGTNAFNSEQNFGLYHTDGSPKLAVAALRG